MKPEIKIALAGELEKIKAFQNKNSYNIAWYILAVTTISLSISITSYIKFISDSKWSMLLSTITLICLIIPIFQSLYVIIRYTVDKRLEILFEAILDKEGE